MGVNEAKTAILNNKTALGIEFGSTRIKAVLINIIPLLQEAMTGKTVMKMESGPIIWTISIKVFRAVTVIWQRMYRKNTEWN